MSRFAGRRASCLILITTTALGCGGDLGGDLSLGAPGVTPGGAQDIGSEHWIHIGMSSGVADLARPPLDVVAVIDKSQSMSIDMEETTEAVARMRVMVFSCGYPTLQPGGEDAYSQMVRAGGAERIGMSFFGVLLGYHSIITLATRRRRARCWTRSSRISRATSATAACMARFRAGLHVHC